MRESGPRAWKGGRLLGFEPKPGSKDHGEREFGGGWARAPYIHRISEKMLCAPPCPH